MLRISTLLSTLLLMAATFVAQEIPAGTVIPVMLQTTLDAGKARTGQTISARVMQDVPLSPQSRIRAGSKLIGQVVEVVSSGTTSGSRIVLSFDRLRMGDRDVSVTMSLRALASMMAVFNAQLPTNAIDDYGTSPSDWATVQIGGAGVYRGDGTVVSYGQLVGKATASGEVTAKLIASRERGCRGAVDGDDQEQALWLFSPSACGTYGLAGLRIVQTGTRDPVGKIILESDKNVHLAAGSGLLLRVMSHSGHPSSQ
jgi:hypothetical protein